MTIEDYDEVRALWLTIRGLGIRALDDSREDVGRFIARIILVNLDGEGNGKRCALIRLALEIDISVHSPHNLIDKCQTNAHFSSVVIVFITL